MIFRLNIVLKVWVQIPTGADIFVTWKLLCLLSSKWVPSLLWNVNQQCIGDLPWGWFSTLQLARLKLKISTGYVSPHGSDKNFTFIFSINITILYFVFATRSKRIKYFENKYKLNLENQNLNCLLKKLNFRNV